MLQPRIEWRDKAPAQMLGLESLGYNGASPTSKWPLFNAEELLLTKH